MEGDFGLEGRIDQMSKKGYHVEVAVHGGTDVGVQTIHQGKVVGKAYSELNAPESKKREEAVVRSRVEVRPDHRGNGIGGLMVDLLHNALAEVGGVTHQSAFTDIGEIALKKRYIDKGYKERPDAPGVYEKVYPPSKE